MPDTPTSSPAELPIAPTAGACGCRGHDEALPELDARAIPHAIRHAAIFGAIGSLGLGQAMVLVAPHDPVPLLTQLSQREGDAVSVDYLQRGPDAWRLRLRRVG